MEPGGEEVRLEPDATKVPAEAGRHDGRLAADATKVRLKPDATLDVPPQMLRRPVL